MEKTKESKKKSKKKVKQINRLRPTSLPFDPAHKLVRGHVGVHANARPVINRATYQEKETHILYIYHIIILVTVSDTIETKMIIK